MLLDSPTGSSFSPANQITSGSDHVMGLETFAALREPFAFLAMTMSSIAIVLGVLTKRISSPRCAWVAQEAVRILACDRHRGRSLQGTSDTEEYLDARNRVRDTPSLRGSETDP